LLLQKSTASKQQEKADETKYTHTHTRELEREGNNKSSQHTGEGEPGKELIPSVL
jgi:hypothetical protein